jgi:cytosine permease
MGSRATQAGEKMTPPYIRFSVSVPSADRTPWYKNTFPTYAGVFLWVGFYLKLGGPTIAYASIAVCLAALFTAGCLCVALYYYVPAMLGMKTGCPLYVVGSSTFGAVGGYLMPGLLMGFLQVGWVAATASVAVDFILKGLNLNSKIFSAVLLIVWIYGLAWVAIKGIHQVARVANIFNCVTLAMILIVFWENRRGIPAYTPPFHHPLFGFLNVLAVTIGYFATGGAAGADFGMHNRNRRDVILGGAFGILGGVLIAGGLPLLSVAGYVGPSGGSPNFEYASAIASVGGLAPIMFFLFAAACLVPTCFATFIASNSFRSMLPQIPRTLSTLAGVTVSAVLAISGAVNDLIGFFVIVGASFGPICGAMAADYLLAGKTWAGPRRGVNWAGYIAWAVGFLIGIPDHLPGLPPAWVEADNPAVLYSFFVGFVVYWTLAKLGLQPPLMMVDKEHPAATNAIP